MWTQFWDMHSGGGLKLPPWHYIYIEAPEDEATVIFCNRFGRHPENVTCQCCGEDYSVKSEETLEQLTGFHRNLRAIKRIGRALKNDPVLNRWYYLEPGQEPPEGYTVDRAWNRSARELTLDEYVKQPDVLVVSAADIKPEERVGQATGRGHWEYVVD